MNPPEEEVKRRLAKAEEQLNGGHYKEALEMYHAVKRECSLNGEMEFCLENSMGDCYYMLDDFKRALPHRQRCLALAGLHCGKQSMQYAHTWVSLGDLHRGMQQWEEAEKVYKEGLKLMADNGYTATKQYGTLLYSLGRLDRERDRYAEALEWYHKAKAALCQFKGCNALDALVNDMAVCLHLMGDFSAAIELYKEAVAIDLKKFGKFHPQYATAVYNLAVAFYQMKRFEESIPRFEEAQAIRRKVFGDQHKRTITCTRALKAARDALRDPSNASTNGPVSDQRICGYCKKIGTKLDKCGHCSRMHYCSIECAQADWERHRPQCEEWQREFGCAYCQATNNVQLKCCSGCLKVRYCDAACQREHWDAHKTDCRKWKAENEKK